jgi:surfeit locus 1 family protein
VVLTVSAALALALLIGLGTWQLYRLAWKQNLLARIDALRAAPAKPAAEILAMAARGDDVAYRRVAVDCLPAAGAPRDAYRYALKDGQVGWRLLSLCRLGAGGPYDGVVLDRGLVGRLTGAMAPSGAGAAPAGHVVGVLRTPGARPWLGPAETALSADGQRAFRVLDGAALADVAADNGVSRPAPYILAVESESPSAPGLVPAALPGDIPNNHLVYALTWFALAGILAWFYGALLIRRLNGR